MNKYEFYSGMQDGYPELKEIYEEKFCGSGVIGGAMRKRKAPSRKRRVGGGRSKRSGSKRGASKRKVAKRSASKRRVVKRRSVSKRAGSKRGGSKSRVMRRKSVSKRRSVGGSKSRVMRRRAPIGGSKRGSSDGKRRTRAPSAYNVFVKKFLNHWKRDNPGDYESMSQQDRMRVAAAEWRQM